MRVPSTALGPIEVGAIPFVRVGSRGREAFVAVVARARFRIVLGEAMRVMPASPLVTRPAYAPDGRLVEPGDFAPYLPRAELLVLASGSLGEPRPARMMISRQGAKLFVKALTLETFAGLGPCLRSTPPDPDGELLELHETFDFSAYQAAPADQLLDYYRGGESIVLDQVSRYRRLQTWVPEASPMARLYAGGVGATSAPFPLTMDRLLLDLDSLIATLGMRACVPVTDERELSRLAVVAAFDAASSAWPDRVDAPLLGPGLDPGGTMSVDASALARELARQALPFAVGVASPLASIDYDERPPSAEPSLASGTVPLDGLSLADMLYAEAPLPFARKAPKPTAWTVDPLDSLRLPTRAASPPAPHALAITSAPGGTIDVDLKLSDVLNPLPFREGSSAYAASPSGPAFPSPNAGATITAELSLADILGTSVAPLSAPRAAPARSLPVASTASPPPLLLRAVASPPRPLGEEFLDAMKRQDAAA